MASKTASIKRFSSGFFLPLVYFIIFAMTLYTTISRILIWTLLNPWINANLQRFLGLFRSSGPQAQIDFGSGLILACQFVIVASVILLGFKYRYFRNRVFWIACLPIILLLIVTGVSRFWSVESGFTRSRYLLFLAAALGGMYVAYQYKLEKLMVVLEAFAALLVVGSLVLILKYPKFTTTLNGGAWTGILSWKMPAGTLMGFAALAFLFRIARFKQDNWAVRIYGVVFYVLSLFLLVKANSITELLGVIAAHIVLGLAILYLRWGHLLKPVHWWILGAVALVALLGLWFGRGLWLGIFNRSSALTGRIPLWEALIPFINQRLFLGYGFGEAFWKNGAYYLLIWKQFTWNPVFAHNGFIEALLDTGIVGLLLWVLFLIQTGFLSLRYFLRRQTLSALVFFAWFVFVLVANIANNHLGSYETFTWLLLVIAFFFALHQSLDREQADVNAPDQA